jgi:hypothetical protein
VIRACVADNALDVLPLSQLQASNATWLEGRSLWVTSHTVPLFNIWYYAARIMPLYRARRLNATGALGVALPPMTAADMLYIPSPKEYHQHSTWESVLSSVVTGVSDVRLEYSDTDFMKQWTGSNLMCVRSAVALGTFGFVVRGGELVVSGVVSAAVL